MKIYIHYLSGTSSSSMIRILHAPDMTGFLQTISLVKRKRRSKNGQNSTNSTNCYHRQDKKRLEGLYEVLTREEQRENIFERLHYEVPYDPPPNGACQFAALAQELRRQRIAPDCTVESLRQDAVNYLREHPHSVYSARSAFYELFDRNRYGTYSNYVETNHEQSLRIWRPSDTASSK